MTTVLNDLGVNIAKQNLSDLIEQTKIMLQKHESFKKDDLTGRMITYFIFKQLDHAMSVIKLDPSLDAVLVVRTMIEGVINLSWALEKPNERVKNWFDYSVVYDFQLLKKKITNGSIVSDEDKREIEENYENNAKPFLKKDGRPYENFRKGIGLGGISKTNTDLEFFYESYQYFSDWVHWGSQSLRHVVQEGSNDISYYESEHAYRVPALIMAFASLLDIATKTNEYLHLGQNEIFEKLSQEAIDKLEKEEIN